MAQVLIVGSLAYDRIMDFPGNFSDHILPEKVHALSVSFLINRVSEEFGGTGGNIAYSLALLGITPSVIATAGTDFARYDERLRDLGIDTSSIAISDSLPTASAYIMSDLADNQITAFAPSACDTPYAKPIDWSGVGLLHVAPTSDSDMLLMPKAAKQAGVPFFFDPGQRCTSLPVDSLKAGIENSSALFVNDYELAMLVEKTGWGEEEIISKTGLLVVTLGAEGSALRTKDGETRVPAVSASLEDPTGAGDAYRAGYITGHLKGLPPETCAMLGSLMGAYAVESKGTQAHAPSLEELKARFEAAYSATWPL